MILLAFGLLAAPPSAPPARLALTISGGVSLGNYEAGLTWAIIRYLRIAASQTELAALTGASAGAANALLAAAMWCEDKAVDDDPDTNLFHDLWAPIGLEALVPDGPSAFTTADALLSSAPLEQSFQRLRDRVFERSGIHFRPRCSVPVGFTVTRDRPQERQVSGLRVGTQRFVVPWRFEVDEAGHPRLVSAPLSSDRELADAQLLLGESANGSGIGDLQASEALLASAAFPFAFRPRELCDCAESCPEENVVRDGTCEGPDFGRRITGLSCNSFLPAGSRQLCRRSYVDGGLFDNSPVGLAVELAEETNPHPAPFTPNTFIVVDPDHRRLAPEAEHDSASPISAPVELITNLIATARETELGRAIRGEGWQRTTQSTLAEAAELHAEAAAVQEEMARIAGAGGDSPGFHDELLRSPRREALGWFLLRCLGDIKSIDARRIGVETHRFAGCAGPLRDGSAGRNERESPRLSPHQIVELAAALSAVFVASNARAEQVVSELNATGTSFARQMRLLELVHDASTVGITSFRFLIGEIPAIAQSGLGEADLLRLRHDLLAVASEGGRLFRATSAMLRVLLSATLLEEERPDAHPSEVAQARETSDAALDRGAESAEWRSMARRSPRIARLIALAPRLRKLSERASSVAAQAAQLSAPDSKERQLVLSRRFSPLGGGQLLNFSGFLDRTLRDLDFYVGVYDAAMQIATHDCSIQGPYDAAGRPAPVFRADSPLELDASASDTQRCLGNALRTFVDELHLRQSVRAAYVIAALARLEVAANLGSRSAATRLLEEPAWSWLGDAKLPPGDQLGRALAAVTSRTLPCRAGATEALCLADPTFDEFLDALRLAGYEGKDPSLREALSDRELWIAHFTGKLVDRAAAIELHSAERLHRAAPDAVLTGIGMGELWARRERSLYAAPAVDFDPSTIPAQPPAGSQRSFAVAAHLLPYRVSLDVVHGGIAFSWIEPALRLSRFLSIETIADAVDIKGSGRLSSTIGLLPTIRLGDLDIAAGSQWNIPWNGDTVRAPGAAVRIAWLQERLAVTAGIRSLSAGRQEGFVTLSVSDLNGLAYWLALWAAKGNQ
jgi:predicted acylesterase/phospholipase RssA